MAGLFGGAHSAKKSGRMLTLGEAAQRALDTARQEKLALAHVAERAGEPQFWFALNILGFVAVEGRRKGAPHVQRLDRNTFEQFVLDEGMTRLCAPVDREEEFTELQLATGELDKYLRWARTVQ